MSSTRQSILQALRDTRLVDPHSHINPHAPASTTLADILGYHYYTELAHSAGLTKSEIESKELGPRELVGRLVGGLHHLTNTAQYAWLIDICQRFFGFEGDVIDQSNWEALYDSAESTMRLADWADVVLDKSNVESVLLTNDFDDKLVGFDTNKYIPCLRTDDLVFHLSKTEVRDRLAVCSGIDLDGSLKSVRDSLEQRFEHFVAHGARACAISLPPDFCPQPVSDGRAMTALDAILRHGPSADASHQAAMARRVFWTIVELCDQFGLPMDLMIGVNRGVYAEGVHQGRDLYDSRVSLIQYRELFNAFPSVKFPISVLASVTNQELVSYSWIFPNVFTNGHWWYSNTPSFIRRDAAARLEAVPRNKQVGYYSDAYKLEFIAPKFDMYRRILSGILMDDFVVERGWSEEKAIELGYQILRGNVDSLFPAVTVEREASTRQPDDVWDEEVDAPSIAAASIATMAAPVAAVVSGLVEAEPTELSIDDELLLSDQDAEPSELADTQPIDPHATLEITEGWENEIAPSDNDSLADPFATIEDVASLGLHINQPWDETVRADEEPSSLSEQEPEVLDDLGLLDETEVFDDADALPQLDTFVDSSAPAEIEYFRADDIEAEPSDLGVDTIEFDSAASDLYADPVTGELTLPVPSEESTDDELGETYLLPEEPSDVELSNGFEFEQSGEPVDFDDLELSPMDDDSDLLAFAPDNDELLVSDEIAGDSIAPEETIEFSFDETPDEPRPNS